MNKSNTCKKIYSEYESGIIFSMSKTCLLRENIFIVNKQTSKSGLDASETRKSGRVAEYF